MSTLRPVCLIVIDGWGICTREDDRVSTADGRTLHADAIRAAATPNMDRLQEMHASVPLQAHGRAVGLPAGLMGNSEVGHLNIGAGRVVYQDIVRIELSIEDGTMEDNAALVQAFSQAKSHTGRVHFVGLLSDGGVHSHISHLYALLRYAKNAKVPEAFIHAITDGRDTAPTSATKYLTQLLGFVDEIGYGRVATVVGRYYAMDRDQRWERTKIAFDALTAGLGRDVPLDRLGAHLEAGYGLADPIKDEFFKPIIVDRDGSIRDGDVVVFFNYRSDRMRQLVSSFACTAADLKFEPHCRPSAAALVCMTSYSADFALPVISAPQKLDNVLAEWLSKQSVPQFHAAETEKYAHVTFFFNGGREDGFPGEDRQLVSSPKVATYDLQPEMSVSGVADAVIGAIKRKKYPFVMCNFAPPDMVGHTGKFEPTVRAVEATDEAIGRVYRACEQNEYVLCVTSDHGNAEKMFSDDGGEHTAHTCEPVPLIVTGNVQLGQPKDRLPALCDVSPTILSIMGLSAPEDMTGVSLVLSKDMSAADLR